MNKKVKIAISLLALILIFMNLFEVYENKYIVAVSYLVITILLFTKTKGK